MSMRTDKNLLDSLEFPKDFEDLTGVLQADLRVIVSALTQRATDRMLLSGRQAKQFQLALWNDLTGSINRAVQPLNPDRH